jgi:hypothetical protein
MGITPQQLVCTEVTVLEHIWAACHQQQFVLLIYAQIIIK